MKQIKVSTVLVAMVALFAVFCLGVLVGQNEEQEGFRIVTQKKMAVTQQLTEQTQPTEPTTERKTEPTTEADPFPININTASVEDLQRLPNIGPTLAKRIVEYREVYGLFESVKELDLVEGIGKKTLEDILDLITVEG